MAHFTYWGTLMTAAPEDHRGRALSKMRGELGKGIQVMRDAAAHTGLLEVAYLLHVLRLTRLFGAHPEEAPLRAEFVKTGMALTEDTVKYAVQVCLKFGNGADQEHPESGKPVLHMGSVTTLMRVGNELNHKYDMLSLLSLADVTVSGERDRYVQIDFARVREDPELKALFEYFQRLDVRSFGTGPRMLDPLIAELKADFVPFDDLFQEEFGVPAKAYFELLEFLLRRVRERLETQLQSVPHVSPGRLDVSSPQHVLAVLRSFSQERSEVLERFGGRIEALLGRLTFDPASFNESELRFNVIARRPLIAAAERYLLVSPELLLDSIRVNTHYTFLEGAKHVREDYKARASDQFLSRVADAAAEFGFLEVARNLPLKDGRTDLGDLDLVLRNAAGEYIIVEGKNHALPLDVYFRDAQATRTHLARLRTDWEAKVAKRDEFLRANPGAFGIDGPFTHIIVTRDPEVLAHFSRFLVLTVDEYASWLRSRGEVKTFQDLWRNQYEGQLEFSKEEMDLLVADGFLPGLETVGKPR